MQNITSGHIIAKDILDLRHSNDHGSSTGEPTDNGVAEKDGDKAETNHNRRPQHKIVAVRLKTEEDEERHKQ